MYLYVFTYTHVYIYICTYINIYEYIYTCVCVCVCVWSGRKAHVLGNCIGLLVFLLSSLLNSWPSASHYYRVAKTRRMP